MSGMRYDETRPLEEHVVGFENNVHDLESAGLKFDEKVIQLGEVRSEPCTAFAGKVGKFKFMCRACGKPGHNSRMQQFGTGKSSGSIRRQAKMKIPIWPMRNVAFVGTYDTGGSKGDEKFV